jgi:hypothetical protein
MTYIVHDTIIEEEPDNYVIIRHQNELQTHTCILWDFFCSVQQQYWRKVINA